MSSTRRFLIAPALARLIRKERSGDRITEGYFPNQAGRSTHVHVAREKGSLVLTTTAPGGATVEERTEVPRAHAAALLDVVARKVDYARSQLSVGGRDISLDRFVTPGALDILSVEFASDGEASAFAAPSWFGPEVTEEPAFQNRSIALEGVPKVPEVALSNAALDSLLDALENRIRPAQGYEAALPRERQITRPSKPPPATNGSLGPIVTSAGDELVRELGRALRPGQ